MSRARSLRGELRTRGLSLAIGSAGDGHVAHIHMHPGAVEVRAAMQG